MEAPKIDPLFQFHRLNPEGVSKAVRIAEIFTGLKTALDDLCPNSREYSIAKTKLEEACFYAKKSMANAPEYQERQLSVAA